MRPIASGGRIVEAYVGEYASGKSELAVNRALDLHGQGRSVTLVDLDTVEPFYTLRPLKRTLEEKGLRVLARETKETFGLGEAGAALPPEVRWALKTPGDVILDVGYGVFGARTLNLLQGVAGDRDLRVLAVINVARPLTATVEDIVQYVRDLGRVDGLINNSHLGEETDLAIIEAGARLVSEAGRILNLPVVATAVERKWLAVLGDRDGMGNPLRGLDRYMPRTFW